MGDSWCCIFQTKPVSNFLGIETDTTAHMGARQPTPRGHAMDMLVIHSKEFGQFRDLHGSNTRFRLFYKVNAPVLPSLSAMNELCESASEPSGGNVQGFCRRWTAATTSISIV